MREDTIWRKKASHLFQELRGRDWLLGRMAEVISEGKRGLDGLAFDLGRMVAEAVMYLEREEIAGPDYRPYRCEVRKWASQPGSVFIGDRKVKVEHPRLRGVEREMELRTYGRMKKRGEFSEELLGRVLRGLAGRRYQETLVGAARAFGVSASSVSRHLIEATATKLKEFRERSLKDVHCFAVFLDTIHRGGEAFIVALGLDVSGRKQVLGFWQGATENHEICEALLSELESRGLALSKKILFVTDGGKGIIKTLKERIGGGLIHQRCTIHKNRNIQRHLAKRWRQEAHRRFRASLEQNSYTDAKRMLKDFEQWLSQLNESAAESLREAREEILTLHRLKVPALLRKTLHSTNAIESLFSTVRDCEGNLKRYRDSRMSQRWLGAVLLHCEQGFKRVKGYAAIKQVVAAIEAEQAESRRLKSAA
ncbi:MAG: IS256 family transposase [Candidatus Binatia bacterium]